MRLIKTGFLLVCAALALSAADVSGRWEGHITETSPYGDQVKRAAVFVLTQNGTSITGSCGPRGSEMKLSGTESNGQVAVNVSNAASAYKVELTLNGSTLSGTMTSDTGVRKPLTLTKK